jgi:hypothetical protein
MLTQLHSASFTPWAARTQQYVKEQVGNVEDKVRFSQSMLWALSSARELLHHHHGTEH